MLVFLISHLVKKVEEKYLQAERGVSVFGKFDILSYSVAL